LHPDTLICPQLKFCLRDSLYRNTRNAQYALYPDCKNTRHASLITASKVLSSDAGTLLSASIRSATLSNYPAGPLGFKRSTDEDSDPKFIVKG
jgi:hypothetical protein